MVIEAITLMVIEDENHSSTRPKLKEFRTDALIPLIVPTRVRTGVEPEVRKGIPRFASDFDTAQPLSYEDSDS